MDQALKLLETPHRNTVAGQEDLVVSYLGITDCFIGVSGSGKTALMTKVTSEMQKRLR